MLVCARGAEDAYSKHSKEYMHSYILESSEFAQGDYGRALFNGFLRENKAMKGMNEPSQRRKSFAMHSFECVFGRRASL